MMSPDLSVSYPAKKKTLFNSKWIKQVIVKSETLKLLEERMGKTDTSRLGISKDFRKRFTSTINNLKTR